MKKTDCSVVKDLLPLYIDDVCSAESKELVEEHLKQCKECTAEKAKMTGEIDLPKDTGLKALMNIQITMSKRVKRRFVVLVAILLSVLITMVAGIILSSYQIPVAYEDLDGRFSVLKQGDAVTIVTSMNDRYELRETSVHFEDANGVRTYIKYVDYYTTPMIELPKILFPRLSRGVSDYNREDWIYSSGIDGWENLSRLTAIYYLPLDHDGQLPADKSDAVLIWSRE